MPICPNCRTGYEDSESVCPQCGEPKPTRVSPILSLSKRGRSNVNWSADGIPYCLFLLAAVLNYVLAVASAMGALFALAVLIGLATTERRTMLGQQIPFVWQLVVQCVSALWFWAHALAFRYLRSLMRR